VRQHDIAIAVIPFEDDSPEGDFGYFATGFSDDLIAALTRFQAFRVIAGQSVAAWLAGGRPVDDAAREWDLQYLVRGTVQRDHATLRVSAQLLQTDTQQIIWADRFDCPLDDVFAVRDEIAATIAGAVSVRVDDHLLKRPSREPGCDLAAYDNYLKGMACLRQGSLDGDEQARPLFQAALETDPNFSRAYAGLSLSYFNEWSCQAWHLWTDSEQNAFNYAEKAAALNDTDEMVQAVLARMHRFRHEHEAADRHGARALDLNPNDANVLIQIALLRLFGGDWDEGAALARKAIRANPLHGNWYHGVVGWNLFMQGDHDAALPLLQTAGDYVVNFGAYRAACRIVTGDTEGGHEEYRHFEDQYRLKIAFGRPPEPGEAIRWAMQVEPFRNREHAARMPGILRSAGLIDFDVERAAENWEPQIPRPADVSEPPGNRFASDGDIWTLAFDGIGAQLVEVKGFHDIAYLLQNPRESVHCLELSGGVLTEGNTQEVIDDQARRAYEERIVALQDMLSEADPDGGSADTRSLKRELDILTEELAKATGLRGRPRQMAHSAERARSAITWRIRSAIKKIQVAHPRLGQHLAHAIRTGNFCSYQPETPTIWEH
jgi:TolB-like protein/tetratricopeptide (TPR) repeat protein